VQPRSKGGETTTSNLRWACKRCNRIKHDLTLDELRAHLMRMLDHLA
jgi:5-methylcytosine-specific restriction endonuclease McrA